MAVAFILDFPGGKAADYDAVIEEMELGGRLAPHGLFHAAGATETGWRVCDVWESAEAFQRFADTKIGPITAKHGLAAPAIRSFDVRQLRRGEPDQITLVQLVTFPGVDAERFDALATAALGADRALPAGNVFHVNGPSGDDWCIMSAWVSEAARDAFAGARLLPSIGQAGIETIPRLETLTVHNALTEPARARQEA